MAKVSLEKDKIKFLLVEGVHQKAIDSLRAAGYTNIEFHKGALDSEQLKASIRDAHFIGLRSRTHLTEEIFAAAEKLVAVGCFCIGTNQVDLNAAAKRGIPVFNAPFSNTRSVAELVIGELLLLLRGVPEANAKAHRGVWNKLAVGSFEARGKKLGIIGYGHIGTQLGILAESLGMHVYFYDIENKLPLGNATQVQHLSDSLYAVTKDSAIYHRDQFALLQNYRLIPAKVVANSLDKPDNLITIDKGSADGIHKYMGVISGTGVVGIVYLVAQHYSIVIPVLNVKSNISCTIQGRGYFGYLRWKGGVSELAYLEEVPRHAHFKLGDYVVTSGYSAVFPPGVRVGKILHVFNSADGLSYRVQLRLSTDFARLRDVCVIDDAVMKERLQIMRAAQDSIMPDGNAKGKN